MTDATSAPCPQCQKPLDVVDRSTVVGYACHDCGGIWLDSETTARVEQSLDTQTIQVGEVAASLAEVPFPPHAASPPCPICHKPMHTLSAPNTDVELDTCEAHGTWFDRGELQTLIRELMSQMTTTATASSLNSSSSTQPNGPHAITPDELRAQMIAEYGVDPSAPPPQATPGLDFAQGVATNLAIDVGISILGALISGGRR